MDTINISGLDKAEVLRRLYNHAKTLGLGIIHATPEDMTREEAQTLLNEGQTYFDYLNGRVMKVRLEGDEIGTALYDRDNGAGAAQAALEELLAA